MDQKYYDHPVWHESLPYHPRHGLEIRYAGMSLASMTIEVTAAESEDPRLTYCREVKDHILLALNNHDRMLEFIRKCARGAEVNGSPSLETEAMAILKEMGL